MLLDDERSDKHHVLLEGVEQRVEQELNVMDLACAKRCFTVENCRDAFRFLARSASIPVISVLKVRDLLDAGMEMKHCVGGYVDRVMGWDVFIYRVHALESATMEVHRF